MRGLRVGWLVGAAVLALVAVVQFGMAPAAGAEGVRAGAEGAPPQVQEPRGEAVQQKDPPDWENWDEGRREQWRGDLRQCKDAVRRHARVREDAAVRAAEMAAREGVPLADAGQMATIGLDEGLEPGEFGPLGRMTSGLARGGMRGRQLADHVRGEAQRRRQERRRQRELAGAATRAGQERPPGGGRGVDEEVQGAPGAGGGGGGGRGAGRGAGGGAGGGGGGRGRR